jgi:hypothetical protein
MCGGCDMARAPHTTAAGGRSSLDSGLMAGAQDQVSGNKQGQPAQHSTGQHSTGQTSASTLCRKWLAERTPSSRCWPGRLDS